MNAVNDDDRRVTNGTERIGHHSSFGTSHTPFCGSTRYTQVPTLAPLVRKDMRKLYAISRRPLVGVNRKKLDGFLAERSLTSRFEGTTSTNTKIPGFVFVRCVIMELVLSLGLDKQCF